MDMNTAGMTKEEVEEALVIGGRSKNPGHALKVSLVNANGETVLDTLVDFTSERVARVVSNNASKTSSMKEPARKMSERLKVKRNKKKKKSVQFEPSTDSTRVIESEELPNSNQSLAFTEIMDCQPKDQPNLKKFISKVGAKRSHS